jgi:hypothetical protein
MTLSSQPYRVLCLLAIAGLLTICGATCAPAPDGDADGVSDATDNCPLIPNADQIDSDADVGGDACDPIDECNIHLAGTTSFAHPDLGGTVQQDELIPFEIKDAAGAVLYKATVQDRVVTSTQTGNLIFTQCIRDVQEGFTGKLQIVRQAGFTGRTLGLIEYRTDGIGEVGPDCATKSADGNAVTFRFRENPLTGTTASHFMFTVTDATEFATTGQTILRLTTGESVTLTTAAPQ